MSESGTSYTTMSWPDGSSTIVLRTGCGPDGTFLVQYVQTVDAGARPIELTLPPWRTLSAHPDARCACEAARPPVAPPSGGLPAPPLAALTLTAALLVAATLLRRTPRRAHAVA